jgi:hypothetical protein
MKMSSMDADLQAMGRKPAWFFTVRPFLFFTAVLRRKGAIAGIARAAACERRAAT